MNLRQIWTYLQARVCDDLEGERGASLVEYAFLVALIAMVCIAAVAFLGQRTSTAYSSVGSGLI